MYSIPSDANADQPNMVHDVQVTIGQDTLKARYFVEGGIIVAMAGDKTYHCPVGSVPPADTVRAMLTEIVMAGQR